MGIKDVIARMGEKNRERKELIKNIDMKLRAEELVQERRKSANQRELEKYEKEDFEEMIKNKLEKARKKKDYDIKFNHNPLNTKNIMKAEWEVMKEPNMFKNKKNIFSNNEFIHKNNPHLLKNNRGLMR